MNEEHITAYLLKELTEEEAERFEEQCFAQDEWPAELESVEQELIDSYLRKQLSRDRLRRFETNYLTTDARKARVLTAESFLHNLCPAPPQKATLREKLQAFWQRPLVPQSAAAVLILAITVSLLWPLLRGGRSPQTFTPLELAMSTSDRATGAQAAKVSLPLGTDALRLRLKLPAPSSDTAGYRVEWENVKGSLGDLKIESQDDQFVGVIIPADQLTPGQYLLKLFRITRDGTEQPVNGSYFFTAEEAPRTR